MHPNTASENLFDAEKHVASLQYFSRSFDYGCIDHLTVNFHHT